MENIGALAILLAFCLSAYSVAACAFGHWRSRPLLVASGYRAVYAVSFLLSLSSALLVYSLVTGDFRLVYVASHSNRHMPLLYKFAAWWGGQEGSLLLWSWLLSLYTLIVLRLNRRGLANFLPYAIASLAAIQLFFLALNAFVASPFKVFAVGREITSVADGRGLNPLLQYWAMALHPPVLYLGYVGFSVPFALAAGALLAREPDGAWLQTLRRWALVTWLFQSAGILLGAAWAYAVLGWGGYWAWDPVENASLLPWMTATAFLHSLMMQEKRGMMKIWNAGLIFATFWLSILGTFLTRSGVVSSVHAFAQSAIGHWFAGFLAAIAAFCLWLVLSRLDFLRSHARLESLLSRESTFLFNNLLLVTSCFAVLWGTLFPLISEIFTGEKISVDALFFNRTQVPLGLLLLLLAGIAPLVAWRRTSPASLKKNFGWPAFVAFSFAVLLYALGVRHFYALVCFALCCFVALTIFIEFYRGARVIRIHTGKSFPASAVVLALRNPRRYGGYIVHLGIVLMFAGFAGSAFNLRSQAEVGVGQSFEIGHYQLRLREIRDGATPNYLWSHAVVDVSRHGTTIGSLHPERRFYPASEQTTSQVAIRRSLREDLYLNFAGLSQDHAKATIQAYVFPLVSWIWIGFGVLVFGGLVCLLPSHQPQSPGLAKADLLGELISVQK